LELVEGWGPEPAVQSGGVVGSDEGRAAETTTNAVVLGEDAGDDGMTEDSVRRVEVEGRGAPEGAPPGGEDLGAGAFLGREERDDAAQDLVGEKADQIGAGATSCHNFLPRSNS